MPDNEKDEIFSELVQKPQAVKKCHYPSCENEIPENSEFRFCEKCRVFAGCNAIRFILDPFSPTDLQKKADVQHALLTQMTGEEILRYVQNLEDHYLAVKKETLLRGVTSDKKKVFKTLDEQISEARATIEAVDVKAKIRKKYEKVAKNKLEKARELFPDRSDAEIKELIGMEDDEFSSMVGKVKKEKKKQKTRAEILQGMFKNKSQEEIQKLVSDADSEFGDL